MNIWSSYTDVALCGNRERKKEPLQRLVEGKNRDFSPFKNHESFIFIYIVLQNKKPPFSSLKANFFQYLEPFFLLSDKISKSTGKERIRNYKML